MERTTNGLRARLMWLALFAAISAFGLVCFTMISERTQQATTTAERETMSLGRLTAREKPLRDTPLFPQLVRQHEGMADAAALDGVNQLFALAPLDEQTAGTMHV